MAALRWILLLAGLLFLGVLASWELRRSRRSRDDAAGNPEHAEPELGHLPEDFSSEPRPMSAPLPSHRTRIEAPPLVELAPLAQPLPLQFAEPAPGVEAASEEPPSVAPSNSHALAEAVLSEPNAMVLQTPVLPRQEVVPGEHEFGQSQSGESESQYSASDYGAAGMSASGDGEVSADAVMPLSLEPSGALVVDWPPERERYIIALRIMGASEQRLSGRATRQALAACGFVHGRYRIFHQAGADGRALSCASLSQPGHFDPAAMDFQRFAGLSVFTVLPGPLPPPAALDRLLETAGDLTQRLQARLQDDQGQPLDAARVKALRASVKDLPIGVSGAEPAA